MKVAFLSLTLLTSLFLLPGSAYAQTRGAGVGGYLSRTGGNTLISITAGRTAPWAEVVVEDDIGEVQAVAEIDSAGSFNFTFNTDATKLNKLVIYATDEIGSTNPVSILGTGKSNFILPPTIISQDEDSLPRNSVKIGGFSYPGATVTVVVSSDNGYSDTLSATASDDGSWSVFLSDLEVGNYEAIAKSSIQGVTSEDSQVLIFEVLTLLADLLKKIGEAFTAFVTALPEPAKQTADIFSKGVTPILTTWFFLQTLFTGLGIKDLITYLALVYFWFMGLLRRRSKRKWGIVYDALTKNPLAGAIVRLQDVSGKLIETDVTGKSGVFSFLPGVGRYKVTVSKPAYSYPSKLVAGNRDGEYGPLYFGGVFEVSDRKPIVNFDIPMDPKNINLAKGFLYRARLYFLKLEARVMPALIFIGFAFSLITVTVRPTAFNKLILVFYILGLFNIVIQRLRGGGDWGFVTDEGGKPISSLSLSLLDSVFNRQLQRRITDILGRFQFLAPKGRYSISVSSSAWKIVPREKAYGGEEIEVAKERDVIKRKIFVRKN